MSDRIVIGHVEGIITAHNNLIRSIYLYKIFQLVVCEYDAVYPNFL